MADIFRNVPRSESMGGVTRLVSVTCSDTVDLTDISRGLMVKTAGDYPLILADMTASVTVNLAAGVNHWLRVSRVYSTGAAATTGVVAVY
jgi:ribosomal protein L2